MQQSFVKRPFKSQSKPVIDGNIFKSFTNVELPPIYHLQRSQNHRYDYVGPTQLRQKIIEQRQSSSRLVNQTKLDTLQERHSLVDLGKSMAITIKRQSVISKFSQHERKQLTRQLRNMNHYKEYQGIWDQQSNRIRRSINNTQPTLLESSIKKLIVLPNPEKQDIIKDYLSSYWEMSLRNNNVILKRHLKGDNTHDQKEIELLMQSQSGAKDVENKLPKLPLEKLKNTTVKQLSLFGKNKLASESISCDPSIMSMYTSKISKQVSDNTSINKDSEILKMGYDSKHRYLNQQSQY